MGHGTAEHFRRHLIQFLTEHGLGDSTTGVEQYSPNQSAAWCTVSIDARELIEGHLKPRRAALESSESVDDESTQ